MKWFFCTYWALYRCKIFKKVLKGNHNTQTCIILDHFAWNIIFSRTSLKLFLCSYCPLPCQKIWKNNSQKRSWDIRLQNFEPHWGQHCSFGPNSLHWFLSIYFLSCNKVRKKTLTGHPEPKACLGTIRQKVPIWKKKKDFWEKFNYILFILYCPYNTVKYEKNPSSRSWI